MRPSARYARTLELIERVKRSGAGIKTKSGIMLGLGETEGELMSALDDLRGVNCDILTLGQYLQPTLKHLPVVEFIPPATFAEYGERARRMGFVHVASGPMVRSSYHADDFSAATSASSPR